MTRGGWAGAGVGACCDSGDDCVGCGAGAGASGGPDGDHTGGGSGWGGGGTALLLPAACTAAAAGWWGGPVLSDAASGAGCDTGGGCVGWLPAALCFTTRCRLYGPLPSDESCCRWEAWAGVSTGWYRLGGMCQLFSVVSYMLVRAVPAPAES